MLEQSILQGLDPMQSTCTGAVREELQLVGRTHTGAGEDHEKEVVAEMKCYELIITPIPCPLVLRRWRS